MGQCYMEFTTYNIFSKQDGVFASFLRTRRDLPLEEVWAEAWAGKEEDPEIEELKVIIATMLEEGRATFSQAQGASTMQVRKFCQVPVFLRNLLIELC